MSKASVQRSRMSPERLEEIYTIVLDLLATLGYERLSLDKVAAEARMSKMTLYRQWNGKTGLVMAAMRHRRPTEPRAPAAASLDEAFESIASHADRPGWMDTRLTFTLLHAAAGDPEVATELRAVLAEPATGALADMFAQAAERGEIERDDALFRRLAYTIMEHFVLRGALDGEADTVEGRRVFLTSVIRPALTFTDR